MASIIQNAPAAPAKKRILNIGAYNCLTLLGVLMFAVTQARDLQIWYWIVGAAQGVVTGYLVMTVGAHVMQLSLARWTTQRLAARLRAIALAIAQATLDSDSSKAFERLVNLFGYCWRSLKAITPVTANTIVLASLLKSPLRFGTWYYMGDIVHGMREGLTDQDLLHAIDFPVGMFFMFAAIRVWIMFIEQSTYRRAERIVTNGMQNDLEQIREIEGMRHFDFGQFIARKREAVETNKWKIGKVTSNGCQFWEGNYNLAVNLGVLLGISWYGGSLAGLAVLIILFMLFDDLRAIKKAEDDTVIPRAELRSMAKFTHDSRVQRLLYGFADPAIWSTSLAQQRENISSILDWTSRSENQRKAVALISFFTLFAISAVEPFKAAGNEELNVRVALLYFVSFSQVWMAIPVITGRASQLVESLDDLEDIEDVPQLILDAQKARQENRAEAPLPQGGTIRFEGTAFHFPFRSFLYKVVCRVTAPTTVCQAFSLKVLGKENSGKSTLLRLIAGEVTPDPQEGEDNARSIFIGEDSTLDVDMGRIVLLVPDEPPDFTGLKVGALFRALCGAQMTDGEIESVLNEIDLLEQIKIPGDKYSGIELLIGYDGKHLTTQQRYLLWLALHLAVLRTREANHSFQPTAILVDGIEKLWSVERRLKVAEVFRSLCNDLHATFVSVAGDIRELDAEDFVALIVEHEDLPADFERQYGCRVVIGGLHGQRLKRGDEIKEGLYKGWHSAHAARR